VSDESKSGEDLLPLSFYERSVIELLRKIPQVEAEPEEEIKTVQ
jgi:hypothetical protein